MPSFGTLKADTLTHSTAGSLATNFVVNGSAKQWVNITGTGTPAANDSFNTSSITDTGTGYHTPNLTNAMSNANYGIQWSQFNEMRPMTLFLWLTIHADNTIPIRLAHFSNHDTSPALKTPASCAVQFLETLHDDYP